MTKMDKQYIEKEYEQAIKEYNALLFRLTISVSVAFQHDF